RGVELVHDEDRGVQFATYPHVVEFSRPRRGDLPTSQTAHESWLAALQIANTVKYNQFIACSVFNSPQTTSLAGLLAEPLRVVCVGGGNDIERRTCGCAVDADAIIGGIDIQKIGVKIEAAIICRVQNRLGCAGIVRCVDLVRMC